MANLNLKGIRFLDSPCTYHTFNFHTFWIPITRTAHLPCKQSGLAVTPMSVYSAEEVHLTLYLPGGLYSPIDE